MLPRGETAGLLARLLAFAVPAGLLGGAYIGQYGFDLYPCEMCWWQRYPHFLALALAAIALLRPPSRPLVTLAALAVIVSGLIGAFHAGVEYHWWEGFTSCSTPTSLSGNPDPLQAILDAPLIRCDQVQWQFKGISLAGFNFLISVSSGLVMLWLLARSRKAA
ncbi:disulfide bond formation protein B [Novosphingobium sp.]|uniref:disulfide bond formation protein B n=1 Tax=Novosphingobium sp. TaxID=1874826 RepID=UPI0035B0285F